MRSGRRGDETPACGRAVQRRAGKRWSHKMAAAAARGARSVSHLANRNAQERLERVGETLQLGGTHRLQRGVQRAALAAAARV